MKIAFWGMEKESGTTSNLMAIGSYIACHSKRQVVMMQLEREKQDLRQNFMRMETELVREKDDYFVLEGLDYLLSMGKQHKLTEKVVRETIEPIIENRLYLVPSGNRKWQSFETEEGNEIIRQIIAFLEKNMDVTLIDCGNRMDDETRQILKAADLVVVNLKQTSEAFDSYFLKYSNLASKVVYLVGNYRKESVYNKRNLQRIYRIPADRMAVVPFNQEFWQACEKGRLDKYMRGKRSLYGTQKRQEFMRELAKTMQILMGQANGSKE